MRIDARALGVGALLLAILLAIVLRGPSTGDSPEHRTDSDAPNGTSALPQLAEALGHPVTVFDSEFVPDLGMGVVFVLNPTTGFTSDEARRLSDYVSGGGALVYAADQGDGQLDYTFGLARERAIVPGDASGQGPMLAGVDRVEGGVAARPLVPSSRQVVLLRSAAGPAIGVEELIGRGRVVSLTDPLPLCNGYLERADNARLAADLLELAAAGSRVAFDEYHHEARGPSSPVTGLLSTPLGAGVTWMVIAVVVGLVLRGRAFGPPLPLPGSASRRSTEEYLNAVAGLLLRTRARALTAALLEGAAKRVVGSRYGLAGAGQSGALRQRAPAVAEELAAAGAELREARGEAELAAAARRLHELAYPERSHHRAE